MHSGFLLYVLTNLWWQIGVYFFFSLDLERLILFTCKTFAVILKKSICVRMYVFHVSCAYVYFHWIQFQSWYKNELSVSVSNWMQSRTEQSRAQVLSSKLGNFRLNCYKLMIIIAIFIFDIRSNLLDSIHITCIIWSDNQWQQL